MIKAVKFLLAAALLVGATSSALASTLTGSLNIAGTYRFVTSGSTKTAIWFNGASPTITGSTGTVGSLLNLNNGTAVHFQAPFYFSSVNPTTGGYLFGVTSGSNTTAFYVTSYSIANGGISFTGYMTLNGVKQGTGGSVKDVLTVYSTSSTIITDPKTGVQTTQYNYSGVLTVTPEPNSIVLMGTGLLAACALIAVKRRRTFAAAV